MIYRLTYLSDDLQVKGYLCMPTNFTHYKGTPLKQYINQSVSDISGVEIIVSPLDIDGEGTSTLQKDKLPLLIYCRGGIGKYGAVKLDWLRQFAARGYAVFAPAYRGNEGSQGRDEFGGRDVMDVLSAMTWLSKLSFVDTESIYMLGFSRGSINAAKAAAETSAISKLILWSGVSDMMLTYEERIDLRRMLKRVIGGTPTKYPERYLERSPLHFADKIQCPVLIVHGTLDEQVSVRHGLQMYERLFETRKDVSLHLYEDLGHHFPAAWHETAVNRIFDWLDKPVTS
ncbi:prolyl oligopeptidase family serine peptidase [Paenibacillus sp. N3/727]|uniref:alpha/beta hydrolase family protein n=1 Tax=Paenibacillus sp. N3/727 TaxID=2925845 RepID=UPI001F531FD3|nr:prolyl oligopeptidase family serine peptidase [Paenibacillus sp. N3/727]UNK16544.1 prolyl oligopeptidase family serine peptidase [Paenibacillus sp. N3/727]